VSWRTQRPRLAGGTDVRLGIAGLVVMLALGGCSSGSDDPQGADDSTREPSAEVGGGVEPGSNQPGALTLLPGRPAGTVLTSGGQFSVSGDTNVLVDVAQLSGGEVRVARGPDEALPTALTYPPYRASGAYPRAVLTLTPTSGDALSPGGVDFEYGAVFRLDATSSGRVDDNGDNVFQRGLSGDMSQLKLEVDHGRPSCKIHGESGEVTVRAEAKINRGDWYEVRCSRTGDEVSVGVAPYGGGAATLKTASGATGDIDFSPVQLASVGGKLNKAGDIVTHASDQFNGAIAKVWIDRSPATATPDGG